MGLGSTAKKVQKLADVAEKTYKRLDELRGQVNDLRSTVEETGDRVESLESEVAAQRAVLDAIAAEHEIDVEQVLDDAELGRENGETPATNDEADAGATGDGADAETKDDGTSGAAPSDSTSSGS